MNSTVNTDNRQSWTAKAVSEIPSLEEVDYHSLTALAGKPRRIGDA